MKNKKYTTYHIFSLWQGEKHFKHLLYCPIIRAFPPHFTRQKVNCQQGLIMSPGHKASPLMLELGLSVSETHVSHFAGWKVGSCWGIYVAGCFPLLVFKAVNLRLNYATSLGFLTRNQCLLLLTLAPF